MNPTNLYQYYTGQGKKLPTVAERTGDAVKAGVTGAYTGTADQNNKLLSYLSTGATNPQMSTPAAQSYISSQTQNPPTPTTPETPSAKDAYIEAYKNYKNTQTQNTDVANAKTAYNDFVANQAKSVAGQEGRGLGIPLQIVRGEQEKLLKQTNPEATRLQNAIGIAQDTQTNTINSAKTGLDMSKSLLDYGIQENKDKLASDEKKIADERLANPAFELSAGQDRYQYNPTTKQYTKVASMAAKPVALTKAPVKSTLAERTANAISNFSAAFVPGATMGDGTPVVDANGFVTPIAWKAAIADAPKEGLTRAQFIKEFGNYLYQDNGELAKSYGLTPQEIKLING